MPQAPASSTVFRKGAHTLGSVRHILITAHNGAEKMVVAEGKLSKALCCKLSFVSGARFMLGTSFEYPKCAFRTIRRTRF